MYDDGYHNIVNLDYSPVVIEKMRRANEQCAGMEWIVGDVRHLPFDDESVDVCFDKATLDAMMTSEKDPWVRFNRLLPSEPWSRSHQAG